MSKSSVTEQLAEWIVGAQYEDLPDNAIRRVKERFIDSLGVQFAGMSVPTGRIITKWVKAQGTGPESTVVGAEFKCSASFATLANATAGHALEFDDIAPFSGHYASPLTAAALAVGEKLGSSGRDAALAWMVGYEVIAQTNKPTSDPKGNSLLWRGWFNQGFQPALGVAALVSKLMDLDVKETRMALGNAAAAMGGILKNRGSDTKSFTAGNAAMHGVIAAELTALGFTANEDILDGDQGVARLLGLEAGDPEKVLDGLGTWIMSTVGSTLRLHASCGAGHWGQDAVQKILERRPTDTKEIDSIEVYIPGFLMDMLPYHSPRTGLEAKYSIEYDMAVVAIDGRAGLHQYDDAAVLRPEARDLMERVRYIPEDVQPGTPLGSRVVLKLKSGDELEETVNRSHGTPADPLSESEILGKFHECSEALVPEEQRNEVIDLCWQLESLESMRTLGDAVGTIKT